MNEELMEILISSAMELMEPTRTRLMEKNQKLKECRKNCGELEMKFEEELSALRNVNPDMAEFFEEHYNSYEHLGYQMELFSYVQGYIDCVQLLSGLGVLQGSNQEWIDSYLEKYPVKNNNE